MGYRWYDYHKVNPAYPFGHGISYTTFAYQNLEVNDRIVTIDVSNIGETYGKEVV